MSIKTGYGDEPGVPVIDYERCTHCSLCTKVCTTETLMMENKKVRIYGDTAFGCIGCAQCMLVCPEGCINVTGRDTSPEDLLKYPDDNELASPAGLEALLLMRRSVRDFKKRHVEREMLDEIIRISSTAPMGIPPSDVGIVILSGRDKVNQFSSDVIEVIERKKKGLNLFTLRLARPFMKKSTYEAFTSFIVPLMAVVTENKKKGMDHLLYNAPAAFVFHQSSFGDVADSDIACTYAMIAAQSLGLATCMIGTVPPFLNMDKNLKRKWGIPQENKAGLTLILGYPKFKYQKAIRRRFASIKYA